MFKKIQPKQKLRYWLEDVSGRIELQTAENGESLAPICTGAVLGCYGYADNQGIFIVEAWALPGYPPSPPQTQAVHRMLKSTGYLCFVSGFEFGLESPTLPLEMLFNFLAGQGSSFERTLSQQIVRVVVCGNTMVSPSDLYEADKGLFAQESNNKIYNKMGELLDQMQDWLERLSDIVPVDLMPGHNELSNGFLPQQPLSRCMFPLFSDQDAPAVHNDQL